MLQKTSLGERCAPCNFVLLVMLGGTLGLPHRVPGGVPNLVDYGKINVETNLIDMETLRNMDVPLVSSLLTLKRLHTFS